MVSFKKTFGLGLVFLAFSVFAIADEPGGPIACENITPVVASDCAMGCDVGEICAAMMDPARTKPVACECI